MYVLLYLTYLPCYSTHIRRMHSLNKKMRVDMNITFPALHCDDLHLDAMDVAGDS